jgi:sulfide:quinone oxidoreductase
VTYENGAELPYTILAAVPTHRAPKVVRDAGLTDASGFVPVELGTFRASVPDVYAIGDVAALKLPGGGPHPKAGIFAEAQGIAVAQALAAKMAGAESSPYPGVGVCYVETGRGMAAPAVISLLEPGGPSARMDAPSPDGLARKAEFERERFDRWFGG